MRELEDLPVDSEQFYAPFPAMQLVKAVEEDDRRVLYLQASNEGLDQENEVVVMKALKDAKDYYLSHGVLSWDHKHKLLNDPGYIIGEPMEVRFSDKGETLVKGFLYSENKIANNLWDNIQSGASRLGASIGGAIVKRDQDGGGVGQIKKVIWDETAITHKPVNDGTLGKVQLLPFNEFAKALSAGAGVNAAAFTGGRALTRESLQGAMRRMRQQKLPPGLTAVPYAELRRAFDGVISSVMKGRITSYNDVVDYVLDLGFSTEVCAELIKFISERLPEIRVEEVA